MNKMAIHLIIQQLLKDSQPEDIWDESVGKIESLTPIIKVSERESVALEPANSFYVGTVAGVMPTLIVSEELYPFYLDLDPDEFVARLNKAIFDYIRVKVLEAKQYDSWNDECVWYKPNKAFVNWFQEKGIDLDSQRSFITNDGKVEKKAIARPKGKGGRPLDPKLEEKKRSLSKDYYRLTQKQGYKSSEAIKTLSKKYGWKKSTVQTYLK
jgi:hypothetical protein